MTHAVIRIRTVTMLLVGLGLLPALAPAQTTWDAGGGVDTDWDPAANWTPDGAPAAGASVTIDDSAVANGINLNVVTASLADITFDAGITGGITVADGPGTLTLGNGAAGTFTSETDQTIGFNAGILLDDGGNGTTFDLSNANGIVDVAGIIDDGFNTSALTKTGGGTLTLSSVGNTYGGGTVIENGTLSISADNQLGDAAGGVTFGGFGGGVLEVTTDGENSARTFTLDAGGTVNVADVGETFEISGQITGTGSLNKDGDGTLLLSGAGNNWQGDAFVTAGTLRIAADERIPDTAGLILTAGTFDADGQTETVAYLSGNTGGTVALGAGTFTFGDATNRTYSGAITSDPGGTLNKNGPGWTFFDQDDSLAFQGTLNVNAGELYIDATFGDGANATATVANGATLAGEGTFDGAVTVQSGGYIRPGLGLIGDFTVNDYNPATGSFLEIQVSSTGGTGSPNNDHLKVTHNANLNGNGTVETILIEAPGNYLPGTRWRILQADNARNGQFAGVVGQGQAANFGWSLDYATDPNEVWLILESIVNYAATARTPNQTAVATTLDRIGQREPSQRMRNVFTQLNAMGDVKFRQALDEISPARQTANAQVTQSATRALNTAMTRRFEDLHDEEQPDDISDNPFSRMLRTGRGPDLAAFGDNRQALALSSQPVQSGQVVHNRWSFWFRVMGDLGNMDSTEEQPGFRSSTVGTTFGVDYRIVRGLVVGTSLSYAKSYFAHNDSQGNGEIDSFYQMFYGSFLYEGFYLDGSVGWGYHWYQNDRKMPALGGTTAHSEHDGYQFVGYLGTGYDFRVEQWTFGPTAWMQYTSLHEEDYSETEAGALSLRFDSSTTDSFMTGLGAHVGTEVMWEWLKLKPDLRAEWLHEFQTDAQTVSARFNEPGGSFRVTGPDVQADAWRLGLHLDAVWTEEVTTFLDYTLTQDFGSGLTSNTFWGGIKVRF